MHYKSVINYFYPCLEDLPYILNDNCPVAKDIATQVLCLPLYTTLEKENLKTIVNIINHG